MKLRFANLRKLDEELMLWLTSECSIIIFHSSDFSICFNFRIYLISWSSVGCILFQTLENPHRGEENEDRNKRKNKRNTCRLALMIA